MAKKILRVEVEEISNNDNAEFKKPNSDYLRLDMIIRKVADGKMTSDVRKNYMEYVKAMARIEGVSMTKYLQNLIEKDMQIEENKHKYWALNQMQK